MAKHGTPLLVLLAATACEGRVDADSQAALDSDADLLEAPADDAAPGDEEPVVEVGPRADDSLDDLRDPDDPSLAGIVTTNLKSIKVGSIGGLSTIKINVNWNNTDLAGYSWVRPVAFGTTRYLFMMESQSGSVVVRNVNADDTLGSVASQYTFAKTWTNAEIGTHGGTTYLYLHNSDSGELRRHVFNSNGTINTTVNATVTHADWRDIGNLSSYQIGSTLYLEGVDPWSGKNRVYKGDLTAHTSATWTTGWTSIDHTTSGPLGYILTYKAAGDMTTTSNDATQVGRLAIQSIDAAGAKTFIYDDNAVGGGWTSVRFITVWNTPTTTVQRIFFYNANTGAYAIYGFSTSSGLGTLQGSGTTALWAGDVAAYTTASETFVLLLNEESKPLLDPGKAKKTALCVDTQLRTGNTENVVGYQFGLNQFGRVVYRRAVGHASVSPLVSLTTRTQQNLGSISKMITALTVLELADRGEVDLDSTVRSNLSSAEYASLPAGWVDSVTVRDLLKHQSGVPSGDCAVNGTTLESDCSGFFSASQSGPTVPCAGSGASACDRDYANGNFGALREVIENARNVSDAPGVELVTRNLWATALGIGGITCKVNPNIWYFGLAGSCTPGTPNCVTAPDGTNRSQLQYNMGTTGQYSATCGPGGWQASLQEMLRFMAGVQYAKVLSMTYNDQLMDMSLTAPNGRTAIGWGSGEQPEDPWAGPLADQMTLDKGGDLTNVHTTMGTLPDQASYVLLINSEGNNKRQVAKNAYQYGIGQAASCVDAW